MITLDRLNRKEAIRYLGGAGISLNYRMDVLMDECEKEILKTAEPRFLYVERKAPFDDILLGNDIKKHLEGCHTAVMMCATIGSEIDKLIRISQISDMARAVVLDSFASVAVEQVCQKVDEILAEKYSGKYMTFRFSPGYGDWDLREQAEVVALANAEAIGITLTDSLMLMPRKSITAIIGLCPDYMEETAAKGCQNCAKLDCEMRRDG